MVLGRAGVGLIEGQVDRYDRVFLVVFNQTHESLYLKRYSTLLKIAF